MLWAPIEVVLGPTLVRMHRAGEPFEDKSIPRDVHAEHQSLCQAAMARDVARASAILSDHLLRTLEALRKMPAETFDSGPKLAPRTAREFAPAAQ